MPDAAEHPFRFRMGLKTLLLIVTLVGVTIGGMRWLFFWNYNVFQVVLSALVSLVPFLLAIGTIFSIGIRGRRWGLVIWGGMLLLMPLLGIGFFTIMNATVRPGPGGLGFLSTTQLIQTRLPTEFDQPWVWRELLARLQAGELQPQQVDSAVQALSAHMTKTRPAGWNEPLSWQRDFIVAARQSGAISEPVLIALCDAYYGPAPILQPVERIREGQAGLGIQVNYGTVWATNSGLGVTLLWQVDRVLVNGQPMELRTSNKSGNRWSGQLKEGLDAGDYELTVEVECAYVDEAKLLGLDADQLERKRWPKPLKQWTQKLSQPFKVYSQTEPIVALDTDPSGDPGRLGGIQVERLVAQAGPDGRKSIILKLKFTPGLPMPVSYDVSISLGGQPLPLGMTWAVLKSGSSRSGSSQLQTDIADIDPSIQTADIILTPNPAHIEHLPDVDQIWGKPVTLGNVPIERLDLDAGQGAEDR